MRVRVIATPGHTVTHLSYYRRDADGDEPPAVFTGGSLLFGSPSAAPTWSMPCRTEELTRAQFRSAHRLAELPGRGPRVPDPRVRQLLLLGLRVRRGLVSTIGAERERNDALTAPDEDTFVETLVAEPDRLPGLLRAHGRPEPRRAPARSTSASPELLDPERLRKSLAGPGVGRRPARPHRLRGRAPRRQHRHRAGRAVLHLPRLADPVGHPAHPDRRDEGAGPGRAAAAGPDRHRPSGQLRPWAPRPT